MQYITLEDETISAYPFQGLVVPAGTLVKRLGRHGYVVMHPRAFAPEYYWHDAKYRWIFVKDSNVDMKDESL